MLDTHTLTLRDRARAFEDEVDPYLRGLIATRIYRDHPEWPVVRKRAEIMAQTLETLHPVVLPEERIVGVAYRRFRVHGGIGDFDAWRVRVLHPERRGFDERWPVPDEVRETLRWWNEDAPAPQVPRDVRERSRWLGKYALAGPHGWVNGHTLPDHGILLQAGIAELQRQIAARLAGGEITESQRQEYAAMQRCLEGLARHCQRCAEAAQVRAQTVADPVLRARLEEAAQNCAAIATDAPASFAQALQLLYFSNFADRMDNHGDAASFGRIDQLLYPFYAADIASGSLTAGDAFDLVCHFIIKLWCCQSSLNLTVGGVDVEGHDATNALSTLFLEAMEATEMTTDMSVRLHRDSPDDFVATTLRVVRRGFGRPSIYNDEVTVDAITRHGVALEDARDYAPLGCVEVMIPGRSAYRTMCMSMNLPKVLELVLNQGRCMLTGDQVWEDVPAHFATFTELLNCYRGKVQEIVDAGIAVIHEDERVEHILFPRPWLTLLSRGGIESGVDLTAGQPKYDPVGVTLDGLADVVNSLCAVKHLLFDEHGEAHGDTEAEGGSYTPRLTLAELRAVLQANWEGHEALRQYVLNRLPRYGQDDPEINQLVHDEAEHYAACYTGKATYYGGRFWPMIFGVTTSLIGRQVPKTGALPSGRRQGEMLAQSLQPNLSGAQGCLTALLHSAAAVDARAYPGGMSNVQECDPALVAGPEGLQRLVTLTRAFLALGGMELSLNFLDEATLRAAQSDPDRYRHLMVRVFGLSAQFVNLSPELQENVIARVATASRRPLG